MHIFLELCYTTLVSIYVGTARSKIVIRLFDNLKLAISLQIRYIVCLKKNASQSIKIMNSFENILKHKNWE